MFSVVIITKNEAHQIAEALASVAWADEVVVFDSGSSDGTQAICRQYPNVTLHETDWPGFGAQKNRALQAARGDWILVLDADERVTDALKKEIKDIIAQPSHDGFYLPRRSFFCGHAVRHCGWWPDYTLRLVKRGHGSFEPALVHEAMQVSGTVGYLRNPLLHYSYRNKKDVQQKTERYASLSALMLRQRGRRVRWLEPWLRGCFAFIRTYLLRAGVLDGRVGWQIAWMNARYTYLKYDKLRQ